MITNPIPQKISTMLEFFITRLINHNRNINTSMMRPEMRKIDVKTILALKRQVYQTVCELTILNLDHHSCCLI